jgi:hypothetical protein
MNDQLFKAVIKFGGEPVGARCLGMAQPVNSLPALVEGDWFFHKVNVPLL